VYADHEYLSKAVLEGSPRLQEVGSDILGESVTLLHQLTSMKYVNCLYSFKDKIVLRDGLEGVPAFTVNSIHGYIYFFVLAGGNDILGVLRCYPNSNINYYAELLLILENKCLGKGNRIQPGERFAFEHTFSLKD
jgi:hypothetical protein